MPTLRELDAERALVRIQIATRVLEAIAVADLVLITIAVPLGAPWWIVVWFVALFAVAAWRIQIARRVIRAKRCTP